MKIGIIAGAGDLPVVLTQEVKNAGKQVLVIAITKDTNEQLSSLTSEFYKIGVGQVKKVLDTLVKNGVEEMIIIGKVSKDVLFRPMHLDTKAIRILSRLRNQNDASIFAGVAKEIESIGIKIIDQRFYLNKLLPQKGVITKRKLSKDQEKNIEYGIALARKVAELGIGQTVVVKNQMPIAIEAIEGTDEAIRRGGKLCKGGAVVAKAAELDQDFRFDVPTVGPDTIDVLIESKATALAIEHGKAFLLKPEETIHKADKAKISLVVI